MPTRLLVVDDQEALRLLVRLTFEGTEFAVTEAATSAAALEALARERFDIVLLDIMLPDMDGCEVCRRIKVDAATRDLIVVLTTAGDQESQLRRAQAAGADHYLPKPFSPLRLVDSMREIAARRTGGEGA